MRAKQWPSENSYEDPDDQEDSEVCTWQNNSKVEGEGGVNFFFFTFFCSACNCT